MNIGIFTDSFTPEVNGVVTSIQLFITEFHKLGHEVYIFAPNNHFKSANSPKNHIHRYPSILVWGKQVRLSIPIIRSNDITKLNLDVIHVQTPGPIGMMGTRMGRKLKIPLVYTYHTRVERYAQYYIHLPAWLENATLALVAKRFYNKHDIIISPSEGIKKEIEKYVTKPIVVIPTGVDIEKNKQLILNSDPQKILQKYNLKTTDDLLITASRIGKEKNIQFIIEAFPKIKSACPNAKLLIAGNGPDKETLMEQAKKDWPKDIIFLDFLKQAELFSLYQVIKVFLFSSLTETQGMVILEAMAMGLPVVAVGANGVEDLLKNNIGGFITKNDLADFSEKVIKLIQDKTLWQTKKQEALARAEDFSIQKMANKEIEVYNKIKNKPSLE